MKRLAYILLILLVPALAYAYVVGTPSNMVPGNWQAFAVDPGAPDSGVTSTAHVTLKNLVTAIGTTKKSTIVFPHTGSGTTTQYTIGTALDLSSYSNIIFQIENGAQLKVSTGVSGVTLPSPANVSAQPNQQIFSGSGTVAFSNATGGIYPDWWTFNSNPGTTDMSSACNAAMSSVAGARVVLPGTNYYLGTTITLGIGAQLTGGNRKTTLTPAAGVDAITINNSAYAGNFCVIENFFINGGRRGIYIYNGLYMEKAVFSKLRIYNQTAEGIYINGVDVQASTFEHIRTGNNDSTNYQTYGVRVEGATSSNANTWIDCEFRDATVAGQKFTGSASTLNIGGNGFYNCVWENNYGIGLYLDTVRNFTIISGWFENNGREAVGGPYPNIAISGTTSYYSSNINIINTQMSALGINQDNLTLQVQSKYVRGTIRITDCTWSAGSIVDTGSYTYTYGPILVIHGDRPTTITGDSDGLQGYENIVRNGSFEHFNSGTTTAASLWTLSTSDASASRTTGPKKGYGIELITTASGKGVGQYHMEGLMKPSTVYTLSFRRNITALTATSMLVSWYNASAATTIGSYTSADTDWVHVKITFRTDATLSSICGIQFCQYGAGGMTVELDDVMITEGGEIDNFVSNVQDASLNAGSFTCTINQATTTVTDTRVRTNSAIVLSPTTAAAATEFGAGSIYVSTITDGTSFVVTHVNSGTTERTFKYVINN